MDFTREEHDVWRILFERQLANVRAFACREYMRGFDILGLPPQRIPSLGELDAVISPRTGWTTKRTSVRYSDALPWYRHFARRVFLVTDYLRSRRELDFTPEPDMFHDIFGHLPFLVLPEYTALLEAFARAFLRAGAEDRERIKRLAWFSTEFGVIRERGELKIFGAGLLSSYGEIRRVASGQTPLVPFTVENVVRHTKAIYTYNRVLFYFDSFEALRDELVAYFEAIPTNRPSEAIGLPEPGPADWEHADLDHA